MIRTAETGLVTGRPSARAAQRARLTGRRTAAGGYVDPGEKYWGAGHSGLGRSIEPCEVEWHPDLPDEDDCILLVDSLAPAHLLTLRLLAHGWTPQQIARKRGVAEKTVRNQVDQAIRRLGVSGHLQATAVLRRAGAL